METKQTFKVAVLLISFIAIVCAVSAQPHYVAVDIGNFGGNSIYSGCINNAGHVVCNYTTSSNHGAFLYVDGKVTDIGKLGSGPGTLAYSINNLDKIVGSSTVTSSDYHAFLYSDGKMTDLSMASVTNRLWRATGINDKDQIIADGGISRSFLSTNDTWIDFGCPIGYYQSTPFAINNSGQIAGTCWSDVNAQRVCFYSGVTNMDFGILEGFETSDVTGLNDAGQIIGSCQSTHLSDSHAFLYTNGKMHNLGTFGGDWSVAKGINNSGQIVGTYSKLAISTFFYTGGTNGSMYDLNSLIVNVGGVGHLDWCGGINDSGQILAGSLNGHAYLLNPVQLQPLKILTDDTNFGTHTNHFGFSVSGMVGVVAAVERSTNCQDWSHIDTITNKTGTTIFVDPSTNQTQRFYRLRQL